MMYNNIIYATEQEARSYLLPTSTQALFMDPSSPTFYVKATDAFGAPSFEIYDFVARTPAPQTDTASKDCVTHADLEAFKTELLALLKPTQEVTNA